MPPKKKAKPDPPQRNPLFWVEKPDDKALRVERERNRREAARQKEIDKVAEANRKAAEAAAARNPAQAQPGTSTGGPTVPVTRKDYQKLLPPGHGEFSIKLPI